jgi:hypothetical protein
LRRERRERLRTIQRASRIARDLIMGKQPRRRPMGARGPGGRTQIPSAV